MLGDVLVPPASRSAQRRPGKGDPRHSDLRFEQGARLPQRHDGRRGRAHAQRLRLLASTH